jgi:hypothetical protein
MPAAAIDCFPICWSRPGRAQIAALLVWRMAVPASETDVKG